MAYARPWDEATPLGAAAANTIDDIIRAFKVDLRERLNALFADWTADPAVPKTAPAVSVYHSVDQSTSTSLSLAWNSERFDTDGFHDNATNNSRLTVPVGKGGTFLINYQGNSFITAGTPDIEFAFTIRKNGTTALRAASCSYASTNQRTHIALSVLEVLAPGDYIELVFSVAVGTGTGAVGGGVTISSFEMIKIGGAL